jgi:transposase
VFGNLNHKGDPMTTPAPQPYAALIGLDWADRKHDLCLLVAGQTEPEHSQLLNTPEAIHAWLQQLRQRFSGQPIALAFEKTRQALLPMLAQVDFLHLYPVHPTTVARFRKSFVTSGAKDDPIDAQALLELLLKHRDRLSRWQPDTAATRELAALVEGRRKAVNLRTRACNQLTAVLKSYYPQALQLIGEQLYCPLACDFLTRWPTLPKLQRARRQSLVRFYCTHNSRSLERLEQRLELIASAQPVTTDPAVVEPAKIAVAMLVTQLRGLSEAIARYEQRQHQVFSQHADAPIFQSFPGAGLVLAPRLLTAFGTDRSQFPSALNIQQYSGIAPVTERSGNQRWVHWRWACPRFVRQSFHEYANASRHHSLWARAFYEHQRAKGVGHSAAVRALAFKWQRIMWRCWQEHQPYNELRYLSALQQNGSPLWQRIAQLNHSAS